VSFNVYEMFKGHSGVKPVVYFLVAGGTKWHLFPINSCHHFIEWF
jgi:hypothetical protein